MKPMQFLFLTTSFASLLNAQTAPTPAQIVQSTNANIRYAIVVHNNRFSLLQFDVNDLDTSVNPPKLKRISTSVEKTLMIRTTEVTPVIKFPTSLDTSKLYRVYRNGIRLSLGLDYTVADTTLTFVTNAIPEAGEIIVIDYFEKGN